MPLSAIGASPYRTSGPLKLEVLRAERGRSFRRSSACGDPSPRFGYCCRLKPFDS
jgi:hypothetical protein